MNWSDYESVWKRQPLPLGEKADVGELKQSFETKSRKFEAAIRVRDYAEATAGIVVAVAYVFFWWKLGASGWPMGIAMALVLGVSGFFLRERFRARRRRVGPEVPLLAKVEGDIVELRHQGRLVEKLWGWYLGPVAGAMAIQLWVIMQHVAPWIPPRDPWFIAGMVFPILLVIVFVIGFVWWMNQRALRRQLRPRLAELEKLRDELRAEETPGLTTADRR